MPQPGPMEQACLGAAVLLHVSVIVEMIVREIGEQRGPEGRAVHPALVEAVGGNLHCKMRRALCDETSNLLLQADRVRCGMRGLRERSGKTIAQRPDHSGAMAELRERRRDPMRTRCLAVGTGNACEPDPP